MSTDALGDAQRALVSALVADGPVPAGFDTGRVAAVRSALLRKRAGDVARAWPGLAASYGDRWYGEFTAWAGGRPPLGSFADGFAFATDADAAGDLAPLARQELAERQVRCAPGPDGLPRRRRGFAARRAGGWLLVGVAGRVRRIWPLRG